MQTTPRAGIPIPQSGDPYRLVQDITNAVQTIDALTFKVATPTFKAGAPLSSGMVPTLVQTGGGVAAPEYELRIPVGARGEPGARGPQGLPGAAELPTDEAVAAYIAGESDTSAALASAVAALSGRTGTTQTPLIVSTVETAGTAGRDAVAPGVRTGLPGTRYPDGQGYTVDRVVTGITGVRGELTLTTTDTATLATLAGSATKPWDAAVQSADGTAIFVTVKSVAGGTINLLRPLSTTIIDGSLSSRLDEAFGQHLTKIGWRAFAQHIARFPAVVGTRGGIIDGQWDSLPQQYRNLWVKNAALAAYGESNSPAPIVQSKLTMQDPYNVYFADGSLSRLNPTPGGVMVGTHTTGHGATATMRTGRRDVIVELWVSQIRDTTTGPTGLTNRVTATTGDGTVVYDVTTAGTLIPHRIPVTGHDSVTIEVTNADGTPSYLHLSQLTMREAGTGSGIGGRKIVLLGDSWTQYADKEFGRELARVMGANVVTHGRGGMTTDWGLAWWDEYVRKEKPDTVIIHFYTNDLNNNQNSTGPAPGGVDMPIWPNGLTHAQAQQRWVRNIRTMVALALADGIRPVIINAGACNVPAQLPGTVLLERPRLIDWRASGTAELADPAAYINTVGKSEGKAVAVGQYTYRAEGSAPADKWSDPIGETLIAMQKSAMSRADYVQVSGLSIGTDTDSDGLSNGFTWMDYGVLTGDSYTASIVSGRQQLAATYAASGATGNRRLRIDFPVTAGRDYIVAASFAGADSGIEAITDIGGSAVISGNASGATDRIFTYRATAATTATRYAAIANYRTNGAAKSFSMTAFVVIDVAKLVNAAPNMAGRADAEIAAFVFGMKP